MICKNCDHPDYEHKITPDGHCSAVSPSGNLRCQCEGFVPAARYNDDSVCGSCAHPNVQHSWKNNRCFADMGGFCCECQGFKTLEEIQASHDEENKSLDVSAGQKLQILIYSGENTIGRFFINEQGKFDFEGDLTESAAAFIEQCKEMWAPTIQPAPVSIIEPDHRPMCVCGHIRGMHTEIEPDSWECLGSVMTPNCDCTEFREVKQEQHLFTDGIVTLPLPEMAEDQTGWKVNGVEFIPVDKEKPQPFPSLYCINCGERLARSGTSIGFPCECPYKTGLPFDELVTADPNFHLRRKQLKNNDF